MPILFLIVFLGWAHAGVSSAQPTNMAPVLRIEETNAQEVLRSYLHLQEQLHAAQLAIEQTRKEAGEAAAQTAQALAARLESIEEALASQRARELDAMQSSNRVMLIVAGTFAMIGFLAMLLMAYFQWRAVSRLADISASLPALRAIGPGPAIPALGPGDGPAVGGHAEQSNLRLLGALDRLEKRIYELEATSHAPLPESASNHNGHAAGAEPSNGAFSGDGVRIGRLLEEGQSLLDRDNVQGALGCFDEALRLSPGHAGALVKKGSALEKLQKLNEAIDCYDLAIAAEPGLTIAYLHKGGLCNRLQRFNDALECYEQAMRTQEKRNHAAAQD